VIKEVSSLAAGSGLDLRVLEDGRPEVGSLVCVIDLDHGELLHQFVVDLELLLLELGDDLLAQVDGQDRDDRVEVLELFLCVFNRGL